jgi:hypothetical protein
MVSLSGVEHAIDPREELLGRVIRVQDHRNAIRFGDAMHVSRTRDAAEDREALSLELEALAREERRAAVGELHDDRGFDPRRGLERGIDRVAADAVHRGKGELVGLREGEDLLHVVTGDDSGRNEGSETLGHVDSRCCV